MTWWGWWFNTAAGGASLLGLMLAVVLGFVSWKISQATDTLMKRTSDGTQAIIERPTTNTQAILERMDQQADARPRERLEAIKALRSSEG